MDQTLVQSGFDTEIALSERYLQYLLFLAIDTGIIPSSLSIPQDPRDPISLRLVMPTDVDRTYALDALSDQAETADTRPDGMDVKILLNDPLMADLKVTVQVDTTPASSPTVFPFEFFVQLVLNKVPASDGVGLDSMSLGLSLVHAEPSGLLPLDKLKPFVDRTLDLSGLVSGGRIQDIALRKFPADGATPASLHLYVNLKLKAGPELGNFFLSRGDVLLGKNILPPDADLAFATRKDIFGFLAADGKFRKAVRSGTNYSYPLHFKNREGTLLSVGVLPTTAQEGANRLRTKIKAEVQVDNWPDPDVTLLVDIFAGVDADGVLTWNSSSEAHDSGFFLTFLLAGVAAALIPLIGPGPALLVFSGLAIAKQITESLISDYYIGEKVEKRLDATLLDIAPNRLTIVRRRWDPFFETEHQIGLRPGGSLINENGIALWGKAVLTRSTKPVPDVVIRDTEHFENEAPTALRYRIQDIEAFRELISQHKPATDRSAFTQLDPINEPLIFQVTVDDAVARIEQDRLLGSHPYLVKFVEPPVNDINRLLVISERESNEQRNRLIDDHAATVTPQINADNEAAVRARVIADFSASGVIASQQQIDEGVAAGLAALVEADIQAFIDGALAGELDAALLPLLRLELAPTHFGALQQRGVLSIKDFDLIHLSATNKFYYRDHFDRKLENTPAKKKADNLPSKPHYRSTPDGPAFDL